MLLQYVQTQVLNKNLR